MTSLAFRVYGIPAAQGSKRHVGNGVMIESSKKVKPWRQDVVAAAIEAIDRFGVQQFMGPVKVHITFFFPRPKGHYRTGKFAHELKPSAPVFVATKPDVDKTVRSTLDALGTAGVYRDDSLVVSLAASKVYDSNPGAQIAIYPAQETE